MKQYLKPTLIIVGVILLASAISRTINNSESLAEYSERNKTSQTTETAVSSTEPSNTATEPSVSAKEETGSDSSESENTSETELSSTETEKTAVSCTSENAAPVAEQDATLSFYYEPLSEDIITKITGISYVENDNIALEDLQYVHILHYNFENEVVEGELICNKAIAQDLLEIFYSLYLAEYKIEKVRLIDEYNGDDTASMEDNNTSCFNYRVVDGTTKLSKHAYGLAIDINPFYNPYVVFQSDGSTYISPEGSEIYTDRSADFPYKIDENDLCYKLFKEHGFTWGGDWNSCKDYQHFQKAE